MKRIPVLSVTLFVLLSLSIATVSTASATSASRDILAASSFPSVPTGYAYGDYASIVTPLNKSIVGPIAPLGLGCTPPTGTITNSSNISLGSLGGSGTVQTTITNSRTATSASVQVSSDIQNLTLLGGLIRADQIHTSVSSTATAAGATSANNSTFTGLSLAGLPVNPGPNTRMDLLGVGYIILNEQKGPINGLNATSISVNAIDIHITLGSNAGSQVVIGHVNSGENRTVLPVVATAYAYGAYASGLAGPASTTFGPVSPSRISCTGGSNQNSTNGFTSPVIGSSGTITSSTFGQITSTGATATGQTTISSLGLLSLLITADNVTVVAHVDWKSTTGGSRSASMTVTNGKVAGSPLPGSPLPNQRRDLPGIGYVIVNEQYGSNNASGATENIIAFDIHITQSNVPGFSLGARIIVGFASASAISY